MEIKQIARNSEEALKLIKKAKEGEIIIWDEREIFPDVFCDYCEKEKAVTTIDTPNSKDVPLCDSCFKKINVLCGVMKGKKPMHISEIWNQVKDVNEKNFEYYLGEEWRQQ